MKSILTIILMMQLGSTIAQVSSKKYTRPGKKNFIKIIQEAEQQTRVMLAEIPKAKAAKSAATIGVTPGSNKGQLVSPRTVDSSG